MKSKSARRSARVAMMIRTGSVYILLSNRSVKQVLLNFFVIYHFSKLLLPLWYIESTVIIESSFRQFFVGMSQGYSCLICLTARCDGFGVSSLIRLIFLRFICVKFPTTCPGKSGFACNLPLGKENQNGTPEVKGGEENRADDTGRRPPCEVQPGGGLSNGRVMVMRR